MVSDIFVTKIGMTQAWTKQGKRLAITKCHALPNVVVGAREQQVLDPNSQTRQLVPATIFEFGYGDKKLKNMSKPLRSKLAKSGFSVGVQKMSGVRVYASQNDDQDAKVGDTLSAVTILEVGDVVQVRGVTKGRGFAGVVKRYGFAGGPATHGQSDRERAPGSIGAGTDPGKVWKGKKMPGHYGVETKTVSGLVVVHIDPETGEVWLNGPVPGSVNGYLRITKIGKKKSIELNTEASGIKVTELEVAPEAESVVAEGETVETESAEAATDEASTPEETASKEQVSEEESEKK